jgi:hypothetical protein
VIRWFEANIKSMREAGAAVLCTEIRELQGTGSARRWDARRIRNTVCGSLPEPKSGRPIRGETGIRYAAKTQITHVHLIHKDELAAWLGDNDEWPICGGIPLKQWRESDETSNRKPTAKPVRIYMLKPVAEVSVQRPP